MPELYPAHWQVQYRWPAEHNDETNFQGVHQLHHSLHTPCGVGCPVFHKSCQNCLEMKYVSILYIIIRYLDFKSFPITPSIPKDSIFVYKSLSTNGLIFARSLLDCHIFNDLSIDIHTGYPKSHKATWQLLWKTGHPNVE